MDNFKRSLELGGRAQKYIIKHHSKDHKGLRQVEGNFKDYDVIADDGYTAEIKYDILSEKTGNVGFEYHCFGKPSGIATTKALDWIHFYRLNGKLVYSIVRVNDLKSFLRSNWKSLDKKKGGDYNCSKMVVVPALDFADHFSYLPVKN